MRMVNTVSEHCKPFQEFDDTEAKNWGSVFPGAIAVKMVMWKIRLGYTSMGEFIRHCVRTEVMTLECREYKMVVDWLITKNKINAVDINNAIHAISIAKIGREDTF